MHDILIKYPSRGRPERFFKSLDSIYDNICEWGHFRVSCSLDTDDHTMRNANIIERINKYSNLSVSWGISESKVHAINRDLPEYGNIIVVMSDDMVFNSYAFDNIIRSAFQDGLDWLVHLPDQDEKSKLATMYIAGRDFYDRFKYIYAPCYLSLFPDTEIMEMAKELGRYKYLDYSGVISHLLPAYGHLPADAMWEEQQKIGWTIDQKTYLERKAARHGDNTVLKDWIDAYTNDSL